ncbi:bifunctional hexulose-6-phosphate synthase/ribonuclease regulator [Candidatus Aerophobetes bacterium]|uniref:3-hexulose-6-phosphate synthase n=1 Tax=Aerophobetes bacterium TaxID=2030807 RepID=A0A497E5G6_UNCAE|nr:MAG: bifunctional hexulose-6-phosphate synthase/ribonuclease regulator [Candidatus Aerophobetes bacterium]
MEPVLQVALDFLNLKRALKVAEAAVLGGADWLEAGTPLIKSEGLDSVRELRKRYPHHTIVADMKIMDVGRIEAESAFKAGADIVCVLAVADDSVIKECVEAARNYGGKVMADLIGMSSPLGRAKEVADLGVDYLGMHTSIDEQMRGKDPFKKLRQISSAVNIPIAVAGGINSETAAEAADAGAEVIIVGGAIIKDKDPEKATRTIKEAIKKRTVIKTELFKRAKGEEIVRILRKVSTPNISDAMHRTGEVEGLIMVTPNVKLIGPALTVRTYPGDWAKPVEAIDKAEKGQVLVIDVGGVGPAVWGELATHSAIQKGLAGVVINGAIRDVPEIVKLKFPAYAKIITPTAGEPKGFGEIGVPVQVGKVRVFTGDWIVGDEDGLVVIPKERAVEVANRAMDVLERENRIREEIKEGGTLSSVMELLRWEKRS